MTDSRVTVRTASGNDAAAMADVDRQSWPATLATTADEFAARIDAYAEGQLVAIADGEVVGTASAQRVTAEFLAGHWGRYEAVTDGNRFTRSHAADGEIYLLVGVGVLPGFRGRRLGRMLVDHQLGLARGLPDVRRILGFTRPAAYARNATVRIEDYVRARYGDGRVFDPVLAFHVEAGARILSVRPQFRPADHQARAFGVLIEYPNA